jgi:hypothetical protein
MWPHGGIVAGMGLPSADTNTIGIARKKNADIVIVTIRFIYLFL